MALASKIQIEIEGEELKDFLNLTITQNIYTHHEFEVICRMDTFEDRDGFVMEQSKNFIGSVISITIDSKLKGKSQVSTHLFNGLITSIKTTKSHSGEADHVILSGYSPDILMKDNPGSYSFENQTLKQIADLVLKPLSDKTIDPSKTDSLIYTVQYNETRYDFIRRLATRYGEWFFYDGTQFFFGKLPDNKIDLKLGLDLTDFNFSIKMNPSKFKYVAYDYSSAEQVEASSSSSGGKDNLNDYGGFAHDSSMRDYEQSSKVQYNHLNVSENNYSKELKHVVSLEESSRAINMAAMQGSSQNPDLKLGSKVNIKALKLGQDGEVDYGEYIITSLKHSCNNNMNYQNVFEGISAKAKIPDNTNPNAIPHCDSQSAVVRYNNDPLKLGRVRVAFFWQENMQKNEMISPWLRIANIYSGKDMGIYFIPEVGDEVLVDFEGGNAERPYIVGSMHNGNNKPEASWPDSDNSFKGILTKSQLKIEFDETKKQTTIETPGGNKVVLSDDAQSIILHDQNQNKVELTSSGISMESMNDIRIRSHAKVTIEGMNVELSANAGITVKGAATAELSASGQTTVKGAMVMIN